jgi:hypothetical protein
MIRATTSNRRRPLFALVGALCVLAAGCGGGGSHPASSGTGPLPTTHLLPTSPGGEPGPVVTEPTEAGSRPISEIADFGQQILIEPDSFYPHILVADTNVPLTWTNLTTSDQQVVFLNSSIRSGEIPPGGKWSYTAPNSTGIHYVDRALGLYATVDFNGAP